MTTPFPPPSERLARLFDEARELPPGSRAAFLDREAANEPALRARLEALLAAHEVVEGGADRLGLLGQVLGGGAGAALLDAVEHVPGEQVGRYRLRRLLGTGATGAVWLAHDPLLQRDIALKLLRSRGSGGEGHEALLAEARAAARLDHPGIGTIHEVGGGDSDPPFLAMAYYGGGSLRDRLAAGGALSVAESFRVCAAVAEALHAAHREGLVHRDLKPENLVFDDQGRVRLVDFGLAPVGEWSTSGTPGYRSPEQARGEGVDARSDLFALGVVLHEVLTGKRPTGLEEDPSVPGSRRAIVVKESLPGAGLLVRLLAPSREDRPGSAGAVADELRVLEGREAARGDGGQGGEPPDEAEGDARGALQGTTRGGGGGPGKRSPDPLRPALSRPTTPVLALAGVAVLALVFSVLALSREAPRLLEARGSAAGSFTPQGLVLVGEFTASPELEELALAAREALVVDLQQSGFVRVLPRVAADETLRRMGVPPGTPLEGTLALEVAERAGVGAVLDLTVARAGTRTILGAQARDPRTGEERFSVRTSAGERGLLGAVERLSREVRLRLGEAQASLAESRPLPEVTTASLEALRLFALAERVFQEDPARSGTLLEAALELDPGFAMAHRLAAAAGVNQQRFAATAHHLEAAWEHRERLPDRERWLVEAARASEVEYDPHRAVRLYERIVSRFPDEYIAWANLGNTHVSWLSDPEAALDPLERALFLDEGRMRPFVGVTGTALAAGDLERADRLADSVRLRLARLQASPSPESEAFIPNLEAILQRWAVTRAFWTEDAPGFLEACRVLLGEGPLSVPQADDGEVCGSLYILEGDHVEGRRIMESTLEGYLRQGRHRNAASAFQALAMADLLGGDTIRARARFAEALAALPSGAMGEPDRTIVRVNLELQASLLGWPDVAAEIAAAYPPHPDPTHLLGRGGEGLAEAARALHRSDPEGALEVLEAAFPPGITPMGWRIWIELLRARSLEALGEGALARVHYSRAADRGWAGFAGMTKDRLNLVLAHEGLARTGGRAAPTPLASGSSPEP